MTCKLTSGHQIHANPPQIAQYESQLVTYDGTIQAISPYVVESQSTSVKLASAQVESYSKPSGISASKSGSTVSYSGMKKTQPFSAEPLRVHFLSNKPFLHILDLQRDITVRCFLLVSLVFASSSFNSVPSEKKTWVWHVGCLRRTNQHSFLVPAYITCATGSCPRLYVGAVPACQALRTSQTHHDSCKQRWKLRSLLQVSHWGRVYVTESYHVKHGGAAVKGPFSRWNITEALHYDRKSFSTPHIYTLAAYLHPLAQHVSFKDGLGNIMNASEKPQSGLLRVSFAPRYPLLGGWQTRFVLGYTLPLQAIVTSGARGRKEIMFGQSPIFEEVRFSGRNKKNRTWFYLVSQ